MIILDQSAEAFAAIDLAFGAADLTCCVDDLLIDHLSVAFDNAFDNLYRLTSLTQPDPDGEGPLESPVTEFGYDAASQRTAVTDPLGRTTQYAFDGLGRVIAIALPDPDGEGALESPEYLYSFDAVGNLIEESDPLGNLTVYAFDNLYRPTSVTQPDPDGEGPLDAPTTTFTHDAVGNRTSLTDPVGNTTVWVFDGLDRVIEETNELEETRYFGWDAAGNLVQKIDRNERITQYIHDNLGRLIAENWLDGEEEIIRTLTYEFDAANQLTAAFDPDSSYAYAYNALGQVTQIDIDNGGPPVVLTQTFDAAGNRLTLAAEVDEVADFLNTFTYDALSRMTRIEQEGQSGGNTVAEKRVDLAYNAAGQFTAIDRYKDLDGGSTNLVVASTFDYDLIGRLTDLVHTADTTEIANYHWDYDAFSRITFFAFAFSAGDDGSSEFDYDATGQLIGADHTAQTDEEFEFDENGNRTMSGYVTGDNNLVLSDGTFDYLYDPEGNRISKTRISNDPADDKTVEYEWDHRNRLTAVFFKNNANSLTTVVLYQYDVFNRRTRKIIDRDGIGEQLAEQIDFIYDGQNIVLALDGEGSLTNRYLHGPGIDQILADEQVGGAGVLWTLTDNQGSVRDVVTNAGAVASHIDYTSFGRVETETQPTVRTLYGWTGRERDTETGLNGHRGRYYDPILARWISEDPIGFKAGDTHIGRLTGNDPINYVDPDGKAKLKAGDLSAGSKADVAVATAMVEVVKEMKAEGWKPDPTYTGSFGKEYERRLWEKLKDQVDGTKRFYVGVCIDDRSGRIVRLGSETGTKGVPQIDVMQYDGELEVGDTLDKEKVQKGYEVTTGTKRTGQVDKQEKVLGKRPIVVEPPERMTATGSWLPNERVAKILQGLGTLSTILAYWAWINNDLNAGEIQHVIDERAKATLFDDLDRWGSCDLRPLLDKMVPEEEVAFLAVQTIVRAEKERMRRGR